MQNAPTIETRLEKLNADELLELLAWVETILTARDRDDIDLSEVYENLKN